MIGVVARSMIIGTRTTRCRLIRQQRRVRLSRTIKSDQSRLRNVVGRFQLIIVNVNVKLQRRI
jgi:hypothetical protein